MLKAPDDEAQEGDLADPVEKFLIGFSGRSVTRVIPRGQGIGTPPPSKSNMTARSTPGGAEADNELP